MNSKVIITCAVSGDAPLHPKYPPELCYPQTPVEIARAADEAARAGAAIVHVHARDPAMGRGSWDKNLFPEITDRIRQSTTDVIINLTAGGGGLFVPDPNDESRAGPGSDIQSAEQRMAHVIECRPDIASLDVTTGNQVDGGRDFVYLNTVPTLRKMAKIFQEIAVKPEVEIFGPGDLLLANQFLEDGLLEKPPLYQFVLGVRWGAPATPETMLYLRGLLPPEVNWTAFGISRMQMPMAAQAMLLGGNVRVGLEDNLYLSRGKFATNAQLVERVVELADRMGFEIATVAEAREILGIGGKAEAKSAAVAESQPVS